MVSCQRTILVPNLSKHIRILSSQIYKKDQSLTGILDNFIKIPNLKSAAQKLQQNKIN